MWAYLNGIFASLGGCTLPVLSMLVAKAKDKNFNRVRFLLEFLVVQFLIFSAINIGAASFYAIFREIQPIMLLIASIITLYIAFEMYRGRGVNLPAVGGIYGIALSPCSVGFAVATAAMSMDVYNAILNAFLFSLGVVTPLIVVMFIIQSVEPFMRYGDEIELFGSVLLVIVAAYLAFLAGSGWRWVP